MAMIVGSLMASVGYARAQAVGPAVLQRPAAGFSIAIPAGWVEHVDPEIAAAMVPSGRDDVAFMVFLRQEDPPADVEATLSRMLGKMFEDPKRKVVSQTFDVFQKRTALVAEFDDDTSRYLMTLFPRDAGAKSQMYYAIMAIAPKKDVLLLTPAFDQIKAGFQMTALSPAQPAGGPAGATSRPWEQSQPLPADATGLMKSAASPPATTPTASPSGGRTPDGSATRTFTMDTVPFAGEIPADWGGRKTEAGTLVFEGPKGTESYEVSVELGFEPKRSGLSIDDVAETVRVALGGKSQARIQPIERQQANDGTPVRFVRATYAVRGDNGNTVPIRLTTVVLDYPGYYVLMSYYTPDSIYDKYQDLFKMIAARFRYTGR